MTWLRFTGAFDWKPTPATTIGFLPGHEVNVTRRCAEAAIAAGKAEKMKGGRDGGGKTEDEAVVPATRDE